MLYFHLHYRRLLEQLYHYLLLEKSKYFLNIKKLITKAKLTEQASGKSESKAISEVLCG